MLIIQKHDFMAELAEILEATYDDLDAAFFLRNEEVYNEEVFEPTGLLALFLFDKQKYLNRFCSEHLSPGTFINIHYQAEKNALLYLYPYIEHNIQNEKEYFQTLKFLTLLIVNDPRIIMNEDDNIDLNSYYTHCYDNFLKLYPSMPH
jgi:hypothetical protein